MRIKVEVSQDSVRSVLIKLDRTSNVIERQTILGIRDASRHLEKTIQREYLTGQKLNVRTGTLRRAISHRMVKMDGIIYIGKEAKYGSMIHKGTGTWGPKKKPYQILPKNKKALAFKGSRAVGRSVRSIKARPQLGLYSIRSTNIVVKGVMHPGIEPTPFMTDALKRERKTIKQIIEDRIAKRVK